MCSKTPSTDFPTVIAITGGIGSGKSVVSGILRRMGYCVYDCDSRAKILVDSDQSIRLEIARVISRKVINPDGSISRSRLGEIVFSNPDKLSRLNSIVHQHVRKDINRWIARHIDRRALWVETAILYQSGLDKMVDRVWEVTAPVDLRIARVMQRNLCTRHEVESRITSQLHTPPHPHPRISTIINDDISPLLPQIESLLQGV